MISNQSAAEQTTIQGVKNTIQKYRYNRTARTVVLVVLLLIILALLIFWGKMKGLLLVLLALIVIALGLHIADYDIDLGTLARTGSLEQSRVETKKGVKIIGTECTSNNLNCADFSTQAAAQEKYEYCAEKISADNIQVAGGKEAIKRLDVYGLDGDKDGIVCEALPK